MKFRLFDKSDAAAYLHITAESITTEQICQLLWTEKDTLYGQSAGFTLEDFCYSQYYWLLVYRHESGSYDAGKVKITDGLRKLWQAEIDKYASIKQERVTIN